MARIEIPSIVVHNGSTSPPPSPSGQKGGATRERELERESQGLNQECPSSTPTSSPSPDPHSSGGARTGESGASCCSEVVCSPSGPGPGGGTIMTGGSPESNIFSPGSSPSKSRSLDLPSYHLDVDMVAPVGGGGNRNRIFKQKLLQRSHAMREDASPPPDLPPPGPSSTHHGGGNSLTVSPTVGVQGGSPIGGCPVVGRRRLRHQGSSQSSLQESFDGSSPCLSRESSTEYTDSSGVDLLQFIIQTLHKNQKDRSMLLKIERELINLVRDSKRTHHKFQQMSSYHRMLVHRCAAYFGLEHNVDQAGTAVIVNKTRSTRLPEIRFREHFCEELSGPGEAPKRSFLRREFASFEDSLGFKAVDRGHFGDPRISKSFEERQEEYHRAKNRMLSQDSFSSIEGPPMDPRCSDRCRSSNCTEDFRWHDRQCWHYPDTPSRLKQYYDNHRLRPSRLPKVESFEVTGARALRPSVFKSHSFGGYGGVLPRGDSVAMSDRLIKQDSTSSRMSEQSSSSGYKTQRQDTSSTNISNTLSTTPSPGATWGEAAEAVMWAVTDMDAVPPGAMLINPQSGQPYVNQDGSVYRYDPANPPHLHPPHTHLPPSSHPPSHGAQLPPIPPAHHLPHHHQMHHYHHHQCQHEGMSPCEAAVQNSPLYPLSPSPPGDSSPVSPLPPPGQGNSATEYTEEAYQQGGDDKSASNEEENSSSPTTIVPNSASLSTSSSGETDAIVSFGAGSMASTTPTYRATATVTSPTTSKTTYSSYSKSGYSPYYYSGVEGMNRACSMDSGLSEVTGQIRNINILSTAGDLHADPMQHIQQYTVPRHYSQTVYYVPNAAAPGASAPTAPGHIKYIYPQHYAHQPPQVAASHLVNAGASAGATMPPPAVDPNMAALATGGTSYLPGGYTMMSYPGGSVVAAQQPPARGLPNVPTPQEAGGTTYYCAGPQPHMGATVPAPPPPPTSVASVPPTASAMHQYQMTPTSTGQGVTYQPLVPSIGYYGAGLGYHTASAPSAPTAVYATNSAVAAAAAASSSVHAAAQHYHHHHRTTTPPQTTQTQVIPVNPMYKQPQYRWGF